MVTDRNSSISGESQVFELLEELPTNSSDVARTPEYDEEIASGGFVGDISVALVVVASICGEIRLCLFSSAVSEFVFTRCRARVPRLPKDREIQIMSCAAAVVTTSVCPYRELALYPEGSMHAARTDRGV